MRRMTTALAFAALFGASAATGQEATLGSGSGVISGEQYAQAIRADQAIGANVYGNETYLVDLRGGEEDGDAHFVTRLSQSEIEQKPRAPEESWF